MVDPESRDMSENENVRLIVFPKLLIEPLLVDFKRIDEFIEPHEQSILIDEAVSEFFLAGRAI